LIRNGHADERYPGNRIVETGPDGRFRFTPQLEPYLVAVLHESGYARVTEPELSETQQVSLQPWCRIEGQVLIGSKPGADETVSMSSSRPYHDGQPRLNHIYDLKTDAEGRFVFDRVVPGEWRVGRQVLVRGDWTSGMRVMMSSHAVRVVVEPGQTVRVTIGGTGRPVTGRVVVPSGSDRKVEFRQMEASLTRDQARVAIPWFGDGGGAAAGEDVPRSFAVAVKPDGSFRADDVPAGTYQLRIVLYEPSPDSRMVYRGPLIGRVVREVEVPEMPGGRSDEPLDLGDLELVLAE
jgi:hypothetical protein